MWVLLRIACRLGWHNVSCRGRRDHVIIALDGTRTIRR